MTQGYVFENLSVLRFCLCRRDGIAALAGLFELRDIRKRRFGNIGERFLREKSLVACDNDVRKREQPGKHVILNHAIRQIFKKHIGFFFINIQSQRANFAGLQGVNHGAGVNQRAATGVDQHRARLEMP